MNLADRGELTGFLRKHGLSADKSLGQHFICSRTVVDAIEAACRGFAGALEIGPGPGIISSKVERLVQRTILVELDARMVPLLADSAPKSEVILGDALDVDMRELLGRLDAPKVLVANMPYYITGPLLDRFEKLTDLVDRMVLMMQKEVGQKILARPGFRERGALSVNLQAKFEIKKIADAPAGAFLPPPKVDSVVLQFEPKDIEKPTDWLKVVRAGFSQPRKTLSNNLAATMRVEREIVAAWIVKAGLGASVRAHELTEADWDRLVQARHAD